jgi:hypothetical protein
MKCGGLPGNFGATGEAAANATALDTGRAEDRAEDLALTGGAARIQDEGGVGANGADHKPSPRAARAHWRRLLAFV